jgi:hypothetical protein
VAGTFIKHIERARAATQTAPRPAEKSLEDMTQDELDEAMRLAKVEVVEANRAVAAAVAAEQTRPPSLAGVLADLKRTRRRNRRIR